MAGTRFAALLQRAVQHQRAGQAGEARKLYEQVLRSEPRNADALHLLGLVLIEDGQAAKGFQLLRRAVAYAPGSTEALNNLAVELCRAGEYAEALPCFDRLLAQDATRVDVRLNRARALRDAGQSRVALAAFDQLCEEVPLLGVAVASRASLLAELGHTAEALEGFRQAAALEPDNGAIQRDFARALYQAGEYDAALRILDALAPDPQVLQERGLALHALGRDVQAIASYDAALQAGGGGADLLINRGVALDALGRRDEAAGCLEQALALRPGDAEALLALGNIRYSLNAFEAALACFDQAVAHRPDFAPALEKRGLALLQLGRHGEAREPLAAVYEAAPGADYRAGHLMMARLHCCDWAGREALSAEIRIRVAAGERGDVPFTSLAHEASAAIQLQCAQTYVRDKHPPMAMARALPRRPGPVRLAYLSADFREHPSAYLMAGVFEQHDRLRFETTAVSFGPAGDGEYGRRVAAAFGRFVDVSAHADAQVATMMREWGIDIAVDLMGHTAGARTGIFARRAAPVQVNYLGYPGTSGAPYLDAIIADDFLVPPGAERFYSERVVRLPHCFQANDDRRRAEAVPTRAQAGLPEAGLVFCCFSNAFKITPSMFAIWMRLVASIPDSVLWLAPEKAEARGNLLRQASHHGVDPARLLFAPRLPYSAHLARLSLADLALDTFPFNGGATVSDALWAGVPVVTQAGEAFASRMAGSLLHAANLPNLVTPDEANYERVASGLAQDTEALDATRRRVAEVRSGSRLFQTSVFCRDLEAALTGLLVSTTGSARQSRAQRQGCAP